MPLAVHAKLQPALASARDKGHRVFARDKLYWPPGTVPVPVSASDSAQSENCYYEIIDASLPSCYYIDVEFKRPSIDNPADMALLTRNAASYFPGAELEDVVSPNLAVLRLQRIIAILLSTAGTPFEELYAERVLTDLLDKIRVSLRRRLGVDLAGRPVTVLSASTSSKLSFHIVFPIEMDSHFTSSAALSFELASAIRGFGIQCLSDMIKDNIPDRMIAITPSLLFLQLTGQGKGSYVFDLVPYGQHQLYRLGGNSKAQQGRPLRPVLMPNEATRIIGDNDMRFRFKDVFPTYTTWYRTFVQSEGMDLILNETYQPFTISFHPAHPWSTHVANAGCNLRVRSDLGAMDSATAERLAERARRRRETDRGNQVQARSAHRREVDADVNSHILEDTAAIVLDDGITTKQFNLITFGSTVYCPRCEFKDTPEGHRGIGDPSARVFATDAGDRTLHCFSCRSTLFAATTFKRDPMEVLPTERIVFTDPSWRINSHGRTDLSVAAGVRLLAISAATGLGKSTFIRSILNDRLRATVCAISYRESVVEYQAEEWNLTNYKEDGAFAEHHVARISTCIHSITRIPTHMAYDIVVLDEADAIRMSLGHSTMDWRYYSVYQRLGGIMRSASLVILLQADLSQDVVTWASDLCMVDAEDRSFVQRSCIVAPRKLYPMASSDDLDVVLDQLQHFYKSNWDPRRSRARFPTLVFCTQKTFAASLYAIFKSFCTPEQRPGIRLVTRDTCAQDDSAKDFIKDPNAETSGADIVFASPVLSAGLSLDSHYTAGFYFLHKGIIAHEAEYQMTQRLRHQARTDEMHAYVYAYIEKGCGDENLASKERLSAYRDIAQDAQIRE